MLFSLGCSLVIDAYNCAINFQSDTLSCKQGRKLSDAVRNVLSALMTKSFGKRYNWIGAHNKVALRNFPFVYNVLTGRNELQY